jgi:hypothetical protein
MITMSPHVLIDPDHVDVVETMLVVDQDLLALGQDRVVGGVPRNREASGDPGHGQVMDHDRPASTSHSAHPKCEEPDR